MNAEMDSVRAPTLLVWGENDYLVPAEIAPIMQHAIAGSRLLLMKHIPMFEQSDFFNVAILKFLAGGEVGAC